MRFGARLAAAAFGGAFLLAGASVSASADDGQTAFAHRADTMKRMGQALYTTIGRVVRGKAELNDKTVTAAETIVTLGATIDTLFPAGSDVGDSKMKPEIATARTRVTELVSAVKTAAAGLLAAAKAGDKDTLATAYKAQDDACEACHREFRKPME